MPEQSRVAVIGGGCAGLAAAATLAERGIAVTLYESSPQLGGRARGVNWQQHVLDNGQHILLGAYSETLRLLKLAGVNESDALLRVPLQLTMHDVFELKAVNWLPAPLHILAGLLTAKGLSWPHRWSAIRFMIWMRSCSFSLPANEPLNELLERKDQAPALVSLLWEPLCLAALNTPLKTASAQVFLNVLRDSFARSKRDSDMLLPRFDLSSLIAEPLAAYVTNHGGQVKHHTTVSTVTKARNGFMVATDNAPETLYSHVVMAVSPFRLPDITGNLSATIAPQVVMAEHVDYQPIYTVYLQYPAHVKLPQPMLGFATQPGRFSQWVFDRGAIYGQDGLLAVVISAEGAHQKLTQEALAVKIEQEMKASFSDLPEPLWHKVIAEKRATFACTVDLQRPTQRTPIQHLYLAGDYTAGDYPATIEGAVRSGVQCAAYISDSLTG